MGTSGGSLRCTFGYPARPFGDVSGVLIVTLVSLVHARGNYGTVTARVNPFFPRSQMPGRRKLCKGGDVGKFLCLIPTPADIASSENEAQEKFFFPHRAVRQN